MRRRRVVNKRFNPEHSSNRNSHYGNDFMGEATVCMCYKAPRWQGWQHREWSNRFSDWVHWSPADGCWYRRKAVVPVEGPPTGGVCPRVYVPLDNFTDPNWHGGKRPSPII